MKRTLIASMLSIAASTVTITPSYGQGYVFFSNYLGNGSPSAPVYGPEANSPQQQKWGNAADAYPAGTQTYSGPKLDGTNYSVEAWYSLTPVADVFALNEAASAVAGSLTTFFSGPGAGFFIPTTVYVPNSINFGVYLQVVAWDNAGGQLDTWTDAWNAAQAGSGNPVGWSKVFWQPVATPLQPLAGLSNFESFNIFVVPEPSTVALVGLGGLALLLLRRRK